MSVFISFFLISLVGISVLFWRKFVIVKDLSDEEVEARLHASVSVRADLKETILEPAKAKIYEEHLPAFWRVMEKHVRRIRVVILRLESKLAHLSDKLRGKHINMNVEEKSEYWQTLGGAKKNGNGNENTGAKGVKNTKGKTSKLSKSKFSDIPS